MEVKWIKIVTNIFDDEKIRFIESMPNGDGLIVIWFKLLCLAGKSNAFGYLMFTNKLAYTEEMLASIFGRDIKQIQFALRTFQELEMVEIEDNRIAITNWEKHQNIEGMEKIREQTKLRTRKYRERLKLQETCDATVTSRDAIEIDIEEEKELDKENTKYKRKRFTPPTVEEVQAYCNERQNNVDAERFVDFYSSKGWKVGNNPMKDWKASVRTWEKRENKPPQQQKSQRKEIIPSWYNKPQETKEEVTDETMLKGLKLKRDLIAEQGKSTEAIDAQIKELEGKLYGR